MSARTTLNRAIDWIRRQYSDSWTQETQNRYEAGVRWSEKRSFRPAWYQDARYDADGPSLQVMRERSRYFERNNPIVNKLADLFEEYTCGSNGIQMMPASSDSKWNLAAKEDWDRHCQFPDLVSLQAMATLQSLSSRTWFIDGGCFILKTRSDAPPFRPRAQLIEYHRLGTPTDYRGGKIQEGVEFNDRGRPINYYLWIGWNDEGYTPVPAANVIHLWEPSRTGLVTGVPFLHPCLLQLHDLDDLWIMEMEAAKLVSRAAATVETKSGEINAEDLRRQRFGIGTNNTATAGTSGGSATTRDRFIKEVLGVDTIALKEGEKLNLIASQRPGVMQQWLWEYQAQLICAGVGISKQLVFPSSMQGTVTRADLDTANTFFQSRFAVLASAWSEYYRYYIDWASVYGNPALTNRPSDWWKVNSRAPRAVNVDVGRNSAAMLAELAAGATTLEDIYLPLGKDYRDRIRQRAREVAEIKLAARAASQEFGIEVKPGEVAESLIEEAAGPVIPLTNNRWNANNALTP
jgi:lambda family phage portal protein